jgi:hypothetical protein
MATRKTIHVNPLDGLVPNPTTHQTGGSPTAANTQSVDPAAGSWLTTIARNQPKAKDGHTTARITQNAQPPSPADLFNRIQSLEEQNKYIGWLLGGAILLAVLL